MTELAGHARRAPMLKLVDRLASGASVRKNVRVRLPLGALWQAGAQGADERSEELACLIGVEKNRVPVTGLRVRLPPSAQI